MSQPPAPGDHDDGHDHDDGDPEPPEADQGYEAQFDDGFDLGEDYVGTEDNYPGYSVQLQFTLNTFLHFTFNITDMMTMTTTRRMRRVRIKMKKVIV